jgi:hypothetical protein
VAKPLVTALGLRKDRERNPMIQRALQYEAYRAAMRAGGAPSQDWDSSSRQPEPATGRLGRCWGWLDDNILAPVFTRQGDVLSAVIKELYEYEEHKLYMRQVRRPEAPTAPPQLSSGLPEGHPGHG